MMSNPALTMLHRTLVVTLITGIVAGCAAPTTDERPDEIRVTSNSEEFTAVARNLVEPCNNPAEFGRCGCYLDGLQTSCDLVSRCLELGFCKVAAAEPEGTRVNSQSPIFSNAADGLMPICNISAEFGRCGCFLDGLQTTCGLVQRCLELGFCVRAAEQ